MDADLYPLALLIDELKHDDVTIRLNAMRRISTIALALGQERTRTELLKFLEDVTQEDEDEVLAVMAEELGKFLPYVGGPNYAHLIIPPLEALASVEEPVVRDKAVESINAICSQVSLEQCKADFAPLIERLARADWFSSRVSSTSLFATAAAKLRPQDGSSEDFRVHLLAMYKALISDDAPMVRRAAATHFPALIRALDDAQFVDEILAMARSEAGDDQDSVRLLSVDVFIAIAEVLRKLHITTYTSELINNTTILFNDKSWRVRYMAADRFGQLAEVLESSEAREKFVPYFVKLMKDQEAEVRTAIAKQICKFSSHLSKDVILAEIIPNVEVLASDSSQHVRASLASEITQLAPPLGKATTTEYLLPTFLQMLKDEYPDVRLNIISKLQVVDKVIGIDLLSKSLLPAISELAKDKQWRVRLAIIEYIPLLAEQLGVQFFDRELGPLCMEWLWDSVYSIREAAIVNLTSLTRIFGIDWATSEMIPTIILVGSEENYLHRLTSLQALASLTSVVDEKVIADIILPFILKLLEDPIPNIRFNVAKSMKTLAENLKSSPSGHAIINETLLPKLELLMNDEDVDVKFFAGESYKYIEGIKG